MGVIIVCLPSLRPLLRRNMKASSNEYKIYGTSSNTIPTRLTDIRREQGFKVIYRPNNEPESTTHAGPTYVARGGAGVDDGWGDDKKMYGSGSDIELVTPPSHRPNY
jgi:hypothetical protein